MYEASTAQAWNTMMEKIREAAKGKRYSLKLDGIYVPYEVRIRLDGLGYQVDDPDMANDVVIRWGHAKKSTTTAAPALEEAGFKLVDELQNKCFCVNTAKLEAQMRKKADEGHFCMSIDPGLLDANVSKWLTDVAGVRFDPKTYVLYWDKK